MTKNFELFYNRIRKAAGVRTDKELSEVLNLNKSTLSMWKKREKVDYDLLFTKFEQVNLHWLITGEGNMSTEENITDTNEKDQYIIELQRDKIDSLEKELRRAKKATEPAAGYRNVAEPNG